MQAFEQGIDGMARSMPSLRHSNGFPSYCDNRVVFDEPLAAVLTR